MSGSDLTEGGGKHPPSAALGGKSPVLLGLRPEAASFDKHEPIPRQSNKRGRRTRKLG